MTEHHGNHLNTENSNLIHSIISVLGIDHNDILWIYMPLYGLQSFDGSDWKTYTEKEGYLDWQVLSMAVDHDNVKWFGTYENGVVSYDDGTETLIEMSGKKPENIQILNSYPNPFNLSTTIEFVLPGDSIVNLAVYDILGQRVRELIRQPMQTGYHSFQWNGNDGNGATVSSGVYFYVLQTDNASRYTKGLYIK